MKTILCSKNKYNGNYYFFKDFRTKRIMAICTEQYFQNAVHFVKSFDYQVETWYGIKI